MGCTGRDARSEATHSSRKTNAAPRSESGDVYGMVSDSASVRVD